MARERKGIREAKKLVIETHADNPEYRDKVLNLIDTRGDDLLEPGFVREKLRTNPEGETMEANYSISAGDRLIRMGAGGRLSKAKKPQREAKLRAAKAWKEELNLWAPKEWVTGPNRDRTTESMADLFIDYWAKLHPTKPKLGKWAVRQALKPVSAELRGGGLLRDRGDPNF